uniref:Uncharacterized protein n=1 Tax=Magallana gigas TaxID=29159 RepID=K1QSH2_MAGGI
MVRNVTLCVFLVFIQVVLGLKCKSHTGKPVDWGKARFNINFNGNIEINVKTGLAPVVNVMCKG